MFKSAFFPCSDPLPKGKGHRTIKTGTGGGASCQLDKGSPNDHLRELRDAGEWEPMGIQTAPADKEVPGIQGGCSVIDNPLWMLLPWAVFAVADGLKFWRLTALPAWHPITTRTLQAGTGADLGKGATNSIEAQWLRLYLRDGAVQCSQRLVDAT